MTLWACYAADLSSTRQVTYGKTQARQYPLASARRVKSRPSSAAQRHILLRIYCGFETSSDPTLIVSVLLIAPFQIQALCQKLQDQSFIRCRLRPLSQPASNSHETVQPICGAMGSNRAFGPLIFHQAQINLNARIRAKEPLNIRSSLAVAWLPLICKVRATDRSHQRAVNAAFKGYENGDRNTDPHLFRGPLAR